MHTSHIIVESTYQPNAEKLFLRMRQLGKRVWIDSGKPGSHFGRYDVLSAAPLKVLVNPSIEELENEIDKYRSPEFIEALQSYDLPFVGGAIGYFNYEYNADDFGIRDEESRRPSVFGIYEWAVIQDHTLEKAYTIFHPSCSEATRKHIMRLCNAPDISPEFCVEHLQSDLAVEDYFDAFKKIESYIYAGDTYQINFSQRFSGEFSGDADGVYCLLRKVLPSPFSAYLEIGDDVILSLSPERFIQVKEGKALTQPIKGTTPRGSTAELDQKLAEELQGSEKNRAENVMIVDLLRNDFSKSCQPFSVRVPSLFELKSFKNVHHLVSTIEGTLKPEVSPLTFFMRCFPGGSITGAPKKRSMEIIRELERTPRNIYCGSVCYFSFDGQFDSNIAIRTLLISEGKIYCWGGGGIVADSDAQSEYDESLQKIAVLINALGLTP